MVVERKPRDVVTRHPLHITLHPSLKYFNRMLLIRVDTQIAGDGQRFLDDVLGRHWCIFEQRACCRLRIRAAAADRDKPLLGFEHIAIAGDDQRALRIAHHQHRLQPSQHAVGTPVFRQLDGRTQQMALMFGELRFEALEQGERIGGAAGKASEYFVLIEPAHLARTRFEHNVAKSNLTVAAKRHAITAQLAQEDTAARVAATGAAQALRSGRVWVLALVYLAGTFSLYGVSFWMPTIVQELGIGKTEYLEIGLLSMIPWGTAGVVMVWARARSDRTGARHQHVAGALLVAAAGLVGLVLVGAHVVPALIALCFVTAGVLSFFATFWSLPTAFLRQTAAAAGIAWINAVGNLGGHFGPDIIGRIRTATGSANYGFLFLAALAVAGALLTLFATGARERTMTTQEA